MFRIYAVDLVENHNNNNNLRHKKCNNNNKILYPKRQKKYIINVNEISFIKII